MRRILIFTSIFLFSCVNKKTEIKNDDTTTEYIGIEKLNNEKIVGCGYNDRVEISPNFVEGEERVKQIVENIVSYSGLGYNFDLLRRDYMNNAFAAIYKNKRIIAYDPALFRDVDLYSKSYWSSLSILAHEIGHHLNGHTLDEEGSNYKSELEADKFSGFILYKMGASFDEAQLAIKTLGSNEGSVTHPSKRDRLKAIGDGWNTANYQRFNSALPPEPENASNFVGDIIERDQFLNERNTEVKLYNESVHLSPTYEGIIKDVLPYGDKEIQYFYDYPSSLEMKVFITKVENNNDFYPYEENRVVNLLAIDWGTSMYTANASNIPYILSPGMKIRFKVIQYSRTEYQVLELKVLKR